MPNLAVGSNFSVMLMNVPIKNQHHLVILPIVLNVSPLIGRGLTDALNFVFCVLFIFIRKANTSSHSEGIFAIRGFTIRGHFASVPMTNALVQKLQCF